MKYILITAIAIALSANATVHILTPTAPPETPRENCERRGGSYAMIIGIHICIAPVTA